MEEEKNRGRKGRKEDSEKWAKEGRKKKAEIEKEIVTDEDEKRVLTKEQDNYRIYEKGINRKED